MTGREGAAALVAVGDELIAGERAEGNLGWLARELTSRGWRVSEARLIGDDLAQLTETLRDLLSGHELVITTGGLGPTLDDVTRHAAAAACDLELEEDAETVAGLREFWSTRGEPMPESNRRQALLPSGALRLDNAHGTAPGFLVEAGGARLACLPGPPREMQGVSREELLSRVERSAPPQRRTLFLCGVSESDLADRVGEWMARDADPVSGVLASRGVLELKFTARGSSEADLARLEERVEEARELLAPWVFSESEADLASVLVAELLEEGCSVAVAESCTGGQISQRLCAVPGVSAVLKESLVTYSNEAKAARLGVPEDLIEAHGAVSDEVAEAMATGLHGSSGARLVGAVTGIAGPGGGSPEKPVGTVHFAVGLDGAVRTHQRTFSSRGRGHIQAWATNTMLNLMLRTYRDGR
ncbi:MAG: nicotinamide-nucleotide amidohydrolase family protein [Planctomycetes bacterium]|nr:nicotinamide-nucleotide amidohydrolase family protein [Planctomycetota bacterium]